MAEANWKKIKAEYISGGTSYRKLCEKYGIERNALQRVATREKWVELRSQAKAKGETKIVNAVANGIAKHTTKIYEVADKLLDKISKTLDDPEITLSTQEIKHYTSALKDIKDIKGIKTELDFEEQKARIEKLRKEAMGEEQEKDIVVTMGEVDKYAN